MTTVNTSTQAPTGQLSFSQIEQLWLQNGGAPGLAPVMAAIALAESGGHTDSLNNNPATRDYSVGLWQINYFGDLLPGRTQSYGSPAALQADPNLQAKAAISLAGNGSGLGNWTTYTKGTYLQYLPAGGSAPAPVAGGTINLVGNQTGVQTTGFSLGNLWNDIVGSGLFSGGILGQTGKGGAISNAASGIESDVKGALLDLAKLVIGGALIWAGVKMLTSGGQVIEAPQRRDAPYRPDLAAADERLHLERAAQESREAKESDEGRDYQRVRRAARRARGPQP